MATLDDAQTATFHADILANTNPVIVQARADGTNGAIADWYSDPSIPDFWVWQSLRELAEEGLRFDGEDLENISSLNATRLDVFFNVVPGGVVPSRSDHRAFFDDVFSGSNGETTRANLDDLWQRLTNRLELLFTTGPGDGSQGNPAMLGVEGDATTENVEGWDS